MKEKKPNVVIVAARCSHKKESFGIRLEEKDRKIWVADWAFPIKASTSCKEKYDTNKISGNIVFDTQYPGCPYCESKGIFLCGYCNKTACFDGKTESVVCPWCNKKLKLRGQIESLNAGGDR